ncbi:MAG TPA: circularly permuted type 2 ATP-grasp protein [Solirubrobacterales bacterium]|nr:circularly permuted type 2 ATP-grasp protein [Solirubrobacterales bacterium]
MRQMQMVGATIDGKDAAPYVPDGFDEAIDAEGEPRGAYAELLPALGELDLERAAEGVRGHLRERGVDFKGDQGPEEFTLDVVPRVLSAAEWQELERGLIQRARALNEFIRDAYTEQRIVREGAIPARVIETSENLEPEMMGVEVRGPRAPVIGFDVVRGEDGHLRILEDNALNPSGIAYALAARTAVDAFVPLQPRAERRDIAYAVELLGRVLRTASPDGDDPSAALISEGDENSAWFEHVELAERLGTPVVDPEDLEVRDGRLYGAPAGEEPVELQVIYLRDNVAKLRDEEGNPTWQHRLLEPVRRGTLSTVSAFGSGVGDDKLTHAYSEELVRFYLGEEPIIPTVRTYDMAVAEAREEVFERIDEMVVKPRAELGGRGVVIGRQATAEEREEVIRLARETPEDYVAQETVRLSTHPTWCDGRLEPRHIDLRAYAYGEEIAPGGLTRVALERGSLIVNSTQGGGAKDTWVLA